MRLYKVGFRGTLGMTAAIILSISFFSCDNTTTGQTTGPFTASSTPASPALASQTPALSISPFSNPTINPDRSPNPSPTARASGNISPSPALNPGATPTPKTSSPPSLTASDPTSTSNKAYKAVWIVPEIKDQIVSIPLNTLLDGISNFHFWYEKSAFMVYQLDGTLNVRASICPPCLSQSFTLQSGRLTCDRCGTVFNAKTGVGIGGACIDYAKATVNYQIENGNLIMSGSDLNTAYQSTLKPKK